MKYQRINLSLPQSLIWQINKAASQEYSGRSEYIRQAVMERLRKQAELAAITVTDSDQELEEAFNRLNKERFKRKFKASAED